MSGISQNASCLHAAGWSMVSEPGTSGTDLASHADAAPAAPSTWTLPVKQLPHELPTSRDRTAKISPYLQLPNRSDCSDCAGGCPGTQIVKSSKPAQIKRACREMFFRVTSNVWWLRKNYGVLPQ